MLDIHSIMHGLAEKRPIFHSEADFQFALAWHIKETLSNCEVRLEWKPFPDERLYLDVWLPHQHAAIELKYQTQAIRQTVNREKFALKEQSAQDMVLYDFIKDISRLERLVDETQDVETGVAVLLANDSLVWRLPGKRKSPAKFDEFRLHQGRNLYGTLEWGPKSAHLKSKERKNPIHLRGTYAIQWDDYSDLETGQNPQFRYLAVEVSK